MQPVDCEADTGKRGCREPWVPEEGPRGAEEEASRVREHEGGALKARSTGPSGEEGGSRGGCLSCRGGGSARWKLPATFKAWLSVGGGTKTPLEAGKET